MAWGLFKKMVIADHLATCVDAVYNAPEELQGVHFVIATVLFAFQIYCDFSGYTDVAIGTAQVFGYKLMLNFDRPYQSRSIAEFWSRWHISLSTWFRDYLYIPLGGNRVAVPRWYLNLAIVFLVSGLWHGTSWTFVTWGALHAFFMIAAAATCSWRTKISNELGIHKFPRFQAVYQQAAVFAMVCFSWIFFRANSFADAIHVVVGMGRGWGNLLESGWFKSTWSSIGISQGSLAGAVALIGVLELVQAYNSNSATVTWSQMFSQYHWSIRWVAYTCLMLAIVNLGAPRATPFIYFQF
jgi:D-alanyl-lipoteichoic acid acyltransferase DltB (MBOAT superfamily)